MEEAAAPGTRSRLRTLIPSTLTAVRLLALPGVITLWLQGSRPAALGLYGLILLSDVADGWAARRLDSETTFGAFFDVLTDTAIVLGLLIMCSCCHVVPVWIPAVPFAVAGVFLATSIGSAPRYDPLGKYYGTLLFVAIGALLWGIGSTATRVMCALILAASVAVLARRVIFLLRKE